jgi:hypothetical protein
MKTSQQPVAIKFHPSRRMSVISNVVEAVLQNATFVTGKTSE